AHRSLIRQRSVEPRPLARHEEQVPAADRGTVAALRQVWLGELEAQFLHTLLNGRHRRTYFNWRQSPLSPFQLIEYPWARMTLPRKLETSPTHSSTPMPSTAGSGAMNMPSTPPEATQSSMHRRSREASWKTVGFCNSAERAAMRPVAPQFETFETMRWSAAVAAATPPRPGMPQSLAFGENAGSASAMTPMPSSLPPSPIARNGIRASFAFRKNWSRSATSPSSGRPPSP